MSLAGRLLWFVVMFSLWSHSSNATIHSFVPASSLPGVSVRSRPIAWAPMSEQPDHYFTAEPASPAERRQIVVHLNGRPVTLTTAKGVYSPERLDPGTAVLLAGAPDP